MLDLTVNILENFIKGWTLTGDIESISRTQTETTLTIASESKTYHAREGLQLDVDGVNYEIVSVVYNESITIKGLIKNALVYTVPNPLYFHGTPLMTNSQISGAKVEKKFPMIYLYEILRERDKRITSAIARESDLRLFFLDTANFEDWETDDHYSKRLLGLNGLVDFFEEAARKNIRQFELFETDFVRINHVNWGVFKNDKGHVVKIFDDECTGVELSFTLPLKNCLK